MLGFDAVRKIHEHISFNCSLRIFHYKINLLERPLEQYGKYDKKSNGKTCYHRSISLKLIDTKILFDNMNIEPCVVLGNLICGEIALTSNGLDLINDILIFGYI